MRLNEAQQLERQPASQPQKLREVDQMQQQLREQAWQLAELRQQRRLHSRSSL
jgi:hypothetical protein